MIKGSAEPQRIEFDVFGHLVLVFVTDDVKERMRMEHPQESLGLVDAEAATYIYKTKAASELFLPFDVGNGTIAHEAFHVIWNLFDYHGVKPDDENLAYHLGYLVKKIYACLEAASEGKRQYEETQEDILES